MISEFFILCALNLNAVVRSAEVAIRSTVYQAGADAVTECDPGSCLTAVGWAPCGGPLPPCPACHSGQFPADVELDIDQTVFSPAVRRILAVVGGEAPFA